MKITKPQFVIVIALAIVFVSLTVLNLYEFRQTRQYRIDAGADLVEANRLRNEASSLASADIAAQSGFIDRMQLLRWIDQEGNEGLYYCSHVEYTQCSSEDQSPSWWLTNTDEKYRSMPGYSEIGEEIFYHPYVSSLIGEYKHVETYQLRKIRDQVYAVEITYSEVPEKYVAVHDSDRNILNAKFSLSDYLANLDYTVKIDKIRLPATDQTISEITVRATDKNVILTDEKDCSCVVCGCGDECCCG